MFLVKMGEKPTPLKFLSAWCGAWCQTEHINKKNEQCTEVLKETSLQTQVQHLAITDTDSVKRMYANQDLYSKEEKK